MSVFIDGDKIYLRRLLTEDVEGGYSEWFDDSEVCQYNEHHRFTKAKEELISYIKDLSEKRDQLVLAIIDKKTDRHVGNISLQEINYINSSAEIAIIIGDKDVWGKGFGREAYRLMINHGFKALNLNRIACGTSVKNIGLQKIVTSLGFKAEGTRRSAIYKEGVYVDIYEYGLLKSEWEQ